MTAIQKIKEIFTGDTSEAAKAEWENFTAENPAPEWVQHLRNQGFKRFAASGVPTPRSERFKYTDLTQADKKFYPFATSNVALKGDTRFVKNITDVFEAIPDWVRELAESQPAGEETYRDMALWHGVNAYFRDGFILDVPKNTTGEMPLEITITGDDNTSFVPRTFLRIGESAEFTIIERHVGEGNYWNNRVTQIILEPGARLRHYRIQDNGIEAIYTQNTHVMQDRDSTYEAFVLTMGAALSRNQIHVELQGPNAEVRLAGVNLLNGAQHGDTTITIEHQAPHCKSNQTYKTILDKKAHGVFQGKVHVHRPAQLTDGYQLSNAMLLSPTAIMDTKPELEIYADDVKCSHGSTTGQIDTGPMFYLRSRGLSEAQAKLLLMQAFIGPALDEIRDDAAREMISETTLNWLQENVS